MKCKRKGRAFGHALWAAVCLSMTSGAQLRAQTAETGTLPARTARNLVDMLIERVEAEALPPRSDSEQRDAKRALQAVVEPDGPVERAELYRRARRYLATIDADGHSILWSKSQTMRWTQRTSSSDAARVEAVRIVDASGRRVLVVAPPAATFVDDRQVDAYADRLIASIEATQRAQPPCALVVDLTAQTGGNAWPPIYALGRVFSRDNSAQWVDRHGRRTPVLSKSLLRQLQERVPGASVLSRFRGRPFAVVTADNTASAGEMLTVLLKGEANAEQFGWTTYGMTTGNITLALPDEATLLLSTRRYAWRDKPAVRGGIHPDVAAVEGASNETVIAQAAVWAANRTCDAKSDVKPSAP